jgi:hypothetical protein
MTYSIYLGYTRWTREGSWELLERGCLSPESARYLAERNALVPLLWKPEGAAWVADLPLRHRRYRVQAE